MEFKSYHSGSSGNLHHIRSNAGELLIDPGVTLKRIKTALDFKLSDISACLLSHSHKDHSKAVDGIAKAGIDCYMTDTTAKEIKFSGHRLMRIQHLEQFNIGNFQILPFPLQHDVENTGYLISDGKDKLVYATDTYYCKYLFKGLTHIVVECNYSEKTIAPDLNPVRLKRLYKSHFSLENVIKFLKANSLSNVREIHLVHISGDNGHPEYFKAEVQKVTGKPVYIK